MENNHLNNLFSFISEKSLAVRYGDLLRAGIEKDDLEKAIDNNMACLVKDHEGYTIITYTPAIRNNNCCKEDILSVKGIERVMSYHQKKSQSRIKRLLRIR